MHDFRQLSPLDFENLVRDLLQAELGCRLESFGPGKDGGIDFRFARAGQTTVVQVKHYVGSPPAALLKAARAENAKVAGLRPKRYILATSSTMSPMLKDKLIASMPDAPLAREDVLGQEDINNLLASQPEVLRKHFKLWLTDTETLERILHSGIYNRTEAELDVIKRFIPRFVHNESVAKAEQILERRGALVIAGEPGVGKTTLARVLTWLHLAQGWHVFVVDDLREALQVSTTGEKRLIFFDDFLGQISLTNDIIRDADQRLPVFLERVRTNKDLRLIVTTRSYLLSQAQMQSDRLSSERVAASELVLNVGAYTRRIRAQIVFNHVYFSDLTQEEKDALLNDDFYLRIIDHQNFNPRLIDLLTSSEYQSIQTVPIREVVTAVLDKPSALWERPYRSHLSEDSRVIMRALFFSSYHSTVTGVLSTFRRFLNEMGHAASNQDVVRFRHGLKPLEGSIVSLNHGHVFFGNPGIRDFMASVIIDDELLPSVVRSVGTFSEIDKAWDFYTQHRSDCRNHFANESVWTDALARVRNAQSGSAISHVRMALEMYATLDCQNSAHKVATDALLSLKAAGIDSDDELECRLALEQLRLLSREQHEALPLIDALVECSSDMLSGGGPYLTINEIQNVAEAIDSFGESPALARSAANDALHGFINNLSERLRDVGSTSEFDSFEEDLTSALKRYGVVLSPVEEARLDRRRVELTEMEDEQNARAYKPSTPVSKAADVSDSELKSLFTTLRFDGVSDG